MRAYYGDAVSCPYGDHVYYRGVRFDVDAVKGDGPLVLMADVPFSLVADTLLVPYLAYQELTDPPPQSRETTTEDKGTSTQHQADSLKQSTP
jgi:hypothetical protein